MENIAKIGEIMENKEKKELIRLLKNMNILSWGIHPRKNEEGWYDIYLSGKSEKEVELSSLIGEKS